MLGGKARLQHAPQAQRDIRVLGRHLGRLVERNAREADEGAARAGDGGEGDALMAEMFFRELVEAVIVASGIEHIRDQHRVVDRRDVDAAAGEDEAVVLDVLPILSTAGASSSGFSAAMRRRNRDCPGGDPPPPSRSNPAAATAAAAYRRPGPAPCQAKRQEIAGLRIADAGLRVHRDRPDANALATQVSRPLEVRHRLVSGGIDW